MTVRLSRATRQRMDVVSMTRREAENGPCSPDDLSTHRLPMLAASPAMRAVIGLARRVAATDAPVFITGESGTGKERLAEFIHDESRRRGAPLVAIHCGAMPEALLEIEMFGRGRRASIGVIGEKEGLLESANHGTLVLDEIEHLPLSIQTRLLRVMQDGVVRRMGSATTDTTVNVRFIAMTKHVSEEAMRAWHMREDLFYRLRVFPIHLPPLRARREDILILAEHYLRVFWQRHRRGSPPPQLSERACDALVEHSWRGNIRELQNVIERGVVLFEPDMVIEPDDIPFHSPGGAASGERSTSQIVGESFVAGQDPNDHGFFECRARVLSHFERSYFSWLVAFADGNLSQAARVAGIQRATLYRLMQKHGLHREVRVRADMD